jgi:hypothetical protein
MRVLRATPLVESPYTPVAPRLPPRLRAVFVRPRVVRRAAPAIPVTSWRRTMGNVLGYSGAAVSLLAGWGFTLRSGKR